MADPESAVLLGQEAAEPEIPDPPSYNLLAEIEKVERVLVARALEVTKGNRRQTARLLGISLRTLFYKMRKLGYPVMAPALRGGRRTSGDIRD